MSTNLDQERREFEELCKNNPNYPKDFELHRMYQSHIKKWRPLIESNDPSIYSDWTGFRLSYGDDYDRDIDRIQFIVDNSLPCQETLPIRRNKEDQIELTLTKRTIDEGYLRLSAVRYSLDSYIDCIEHRFCMERWFHPEPCIHKPGLRKEDIIRFIERVGLENNPFDLFYYLNTEESKIEHEENTTRDIRNHIQKIKDDPLSQTSKPGNERELSIGLLIEHCYDDLPNGIRCSKFAKMHPLLLSEYSRESKQKRREVQRFVKMIYEWSFDTTQHRTSESRRWAELWTTNFANRIAAGLSEDEIYDWYYINEKKVRRTHIFLTIIAILKFILLVYSLINYLTL